MQIDAHASLGDGRGAQRPSVGDGAFRTDQRKQVGVGHHALKVIPDAVPVCQLPDN